jgi:hypothetical protein
MGVQIKNLSEKIATEASREARWRPPLLIFHRVVFSFSAMSYFSTQAPVPQLEYHPYTCDVANWSGIGPKRF